MEKKTVKVGGLSFRYVEHSGERWWLLCDLETLGVKMRSNRLNGKDLLKTVRPQGAREASLERWACASRSPSGPLLLRWLESARAELGEEASEATDLGDAREKASAHAAGRGVDVVDVGPTPVAQPEPEVETEPEGYTTIDWQAFVYDDGEVRGISLRAMVEAGLYSQMIHAVEALKRSGLGFLVTARKPPGALGGRPATDYIFGVVGDAIQFAASAQTPMGKRILGLLATHHLAIQRLLNGTDEEARKEAELVRAHREERRRNEAPAEFDPMEFMRASFGQHEKTEKHLAQADDERRMLAEEQETQRAELAEIQLELRQRPGDVGAAVIANQFGLYSSSGRPHVQAVLAMARGWDFVGAGMLRTIEVPADGRTSTDTHPMHVFNLRGAIRFGELLEEQHGDGAFEHVTASRTYAVQRRAIAS